MKKSILLLLLVIFRCFPAIAGSEDITFKSGSINLSGTILTPKGSGPFPAVVFVHGSGAEERSNSKSRAMDFVKHGYAALIYDKRGVGKSEGDPKSVQYYSFGDLADDVAAAVNFLAERKEVDGSRIGLVAASQGGWVAPLAASRNKKIAFMVIISGSVTTVGEDNIYERNARLKKEGFSEKDIEEVTEMHIVDQDLTRDGTHFQKFSELWTKYKSASWFKRVYLSENPTPADHPYRKWYKTVVDFSPVNNLKELTIPVLWLYGEPALDQFCPVEKSIQNLDKLKVEGKDYEVNIFPGADHSLNIKSREAPFEEPLFLWLKKKGL